MDTKSIVIGIVAFAALIVGVVGFLRVPAAPTVTPPLGAVAGPDIQGPYYSVNGQVNYKYHVPFAVNGATASTSCSMQAPKEGTSTLVYGAYKLSSTTAAATIVEMGKDNNGPMATTTLIGTLYKVGTGAQASIAASTTPTASELTTFAPGAWFTIKTGGAQVGGTGGFCDATFVIE